MNKEKYSTKDKYWRIFIIFCFLLYASELYAQNLEDFDVIRINYNKTGMIILGSWAAGNLVLSPILAKQSQGQTRYFHQMNGMWNTVNLVIAAVGYYSANHELDQAYTLWQTIDAQHHIEKILLVNAALDIGYIVGGFYLKERALRNSNPDRLRGFGNSLVLQGGFLLLFDVVMYAVHLSHGKQLPSLLENVAITPQGFSMIFTF